MKARDADQYRQAWEWHINQLATLALAANVSYDEYMAIKEDLQTWLDKAMLDKAIKTQLWNEKNG